MKVAELAAMAALTDNQRGKGLKVAELAALAALTCCDNPVAPCPTHTELSYPPPPWL